MKKCKTCLVVKELECFYREKGAKSGRRNDCKKCRDKYREHRRDLNRERYNAYHVKYMKEHPLSREQKEQGASRVLKCRYGITMAEYHQMFEAQGGHCALCPKIRYQKRRLSVDHDHATGATRGILCDRCNVSLSVVENQDFLARAQAYLAKYKNSLP